MPPRKTRATKASKAAAAAEEVAADAAAAVASAADESLLAQATHAVVEAVKDGAHAVEAAVEAFAHVEVPTAEEVVDKMEGVVESLHVGNDVDSHLVGAGPADKTPKTAAAKGKGKGKGKAKAAPEPEPESETEQVAEEPAASASKPVEGAAVKMTMAERQAKLKELRQKMNASTAANRKDLIAEHQKAKTSAKELAFLEKKKRLAETLREQADAEQTGEDLQRNKNWSYSIEDSERWDKKLADKAEGVNVGYVDEAHNAHHRYNKATAASKPDLALYNLQKEQALGLEPGTLTSQASTSKAMQRMKAMDGETLFADGNSLSFAEHKPSEEAVDQVIEQLNKDAHTRRTFSRKRANEDEGDVTYINDANKVFNKKINRYYDKYTKEIRANFERGTAL